jgi:energy-coupling factor transporter transmembrane protein EcfT
MTNESICQEGNTVACRILSIFTTTTYLTATTQTENLLSGYLLLLRQITIILLRIKRP